MIYVLKLLLVIGLIAIDGFHSLNHVNTIRYFNYDIVWRHIPVKSVNYLEGVFIYINFMVLSIGLI